MTERRLLLATATPSVIGGAEAWAATIAEGLAGRGWTVGVLHERPNVPGRIPIAPHAAHFHAESTVPKAVVEFSPDIVLVNGLASPHLEAQLLARWPAALYAHSYYGTCVTGTKRHASPATQACTRTLGPVCLLLYYPRRCGGLDPRTAIADYQLQSARLALFPSYRRIMVASGHMRDEYARHGVEAERLVIAAPPPFGLEPAASLPQPPAETGRLLFVGRVTALKGLDHLVAAIPRASEQLGRPLSITVTGDGPALTAAERLASRLGVSLNLTRWLEGADRAQVFEEHELLVMPSLWPEPWGMAGLEAASRGVPAVAYASGGIPEWLTPGVSGELAPSNPPTVWGLADALVRALADREHHARLSRGAWEMAQGHLAATHVAKIDQVLRGVLEE